MGYNFGFLIVVLPVFGLLLASLWIIYNKAGQPGWASLIPIYNIIVLLEITGRPWWWIFMFFIPFVNIVFFIMMYNSLSRSFGKDEAFTVGLVLLNIVFLPILAFGDSQYIGPNGEKAGYRHKDGGPLDQV